MCKITGYLFLKRERKRGKRGFSKRGIKRYKINITKVGKVRGDKGGLVD